MTKADGHESRDRRGESMKHQSMTGKHAAIRAELQQKTDREKKTSDTERALERDGRTGRERPLPPKRDPRRSRVILIALFLVTIALLALSFALRGAAVERRRETHLRQARESFAQSDYETALGHLRQADLKGEEEEIRLLMVDCYEALGRYDKALELLRGMDTKQERIIQRIDALENAKEQELKADKVVIAGREYERDTRSLVIRDTALGAEDLAQIAQLYSLNSLTLSGTGIRDVSVLQTLGGLTMLDLSGNEIRDVGPLGSLTGLRSLYLDGNPIDDFTPLLALRELSMLSIRGIPLREEQLSALAEGLPGCAIHSETAQAEDQKLTLGGVTFYESVTELYLSSLQLSDISALSNCRKLVRLDLSGNRITDLSPLMDLPELEWLNVADNQIVDLRPLMAMRTLQTVDASGNAVSSTAALAALTGLKELRLDGNPLSDLSGLSSLNALETLGLSGTGLTDELLPSIEALPALKLLDLRENSALTGEAVEALKRSLKGCLVEHSRLVYTVEINGQRYRQDLTSLDLSGRGEAFDLSSLALIPDLETLDISGNQLENIYGLLPMKKLRELDLSDNQISDTTPLAELFGLEKLDLSNNRISSVTALMGLTHLKELDLRGNPLPQEQLEKIEKTLVNCEIRHD